MLNILERLLYRMSAEQANENIRVNTIRLFLFA
jgi:hypothetical protein